MSSRERPGPLAQLGRTVGDAGRYSGGEGGKELSRTSGAERSADSGPSGVMELERVASHEPRIGATLGRDYRLTAVLVRTLESTIFAAEHVRTHRKLAIKVWKKHLDELELDQFRNEAEVLGSIRHPHVAQVIDFGSTDERLAYLVMELLEGQTLETLLERGPLGAAQVARLTRQIASALAAAHRAGLVHTDLRPHNVLLVDVGRDLYAKLLDFGLTKRLDEPRGPTSGRRIRSEHAAWYRAPELASAAEGASSEASPDARSDQFSLGCVVYEMLTGQRPFPTASSQQASIHRAPARTLAEGGYAASPELEEAVARALALDPALRFEQLGDFAQVVACSSPVDRTLVTRAVLAPPSDERESREQKRPDPRLVTLADGTTPVDESSGD